MVERTAPTAAEPMPEREIVIAPPERWVDAYLALARQHERVAQQAQTHGDVGTRELAAWLAGRLEGLKLAADILGVGLPDLEHFA